MKLEVYLEADSIMDLIAQFKKALAGVEQTAEAPAEPKKPRGRKKAAEAPDPEPEAKAEPKAEPEVEPEAEELTLEKVKEHVHAYAEVAVLNDPKNSDAARAAFKSILDHFKIERFSKLTEENFAEAIDLAINKKAELEAK